VAQKSEIGSRFGDNKSLGGEPPKRPKAEIDPATGRVIRPKVEDPTPPPIMPSLIGAKS